MKQQDLAATQFGTMAAHYLTSTVHARGADLDRLAALAPGVRQAALDLGCGAGHASFALARGHALRVVACDPAPAMLDVVREEGRSRGYAQLETVAGTAESIPLADHSVDLVVTRYSAHHWADVPKALAEVRRVLSDDGTLVVIDVIAPEDPLLDTVQQTIEFLRDTSHVRDYRVSEWRRMFEQAGFATPASDTWKLLLEFQSWVARIGTPAERVAALQAVLRDLPSEARRYFAVAADGSFATDSAWMQARGAR